MISKFQTDNFSRCSLAMQFHGFLQTAAPERIGQFVISLSGGLNSVNRRIVFIAIAFSGEFNGGEVFDAAKDVGLDVE